MELDFGFLEKQNPKPLNTSFLGILPNLAEKKSTFMLSRHSAVDNQGLCIHHK